ncbi:Shedu immune nuclease family protein [Rhodococcus sp. 008]|uniref:Shedu immune nuclease family protein n=1 Tax=Rhodococcus sp. 008 TaxID=1723645 RepID=UPI0008060BA0|nr:Shedu immune nuclease family protein [Rhodococcus sp. 008]ANQ71281.1 hypothetical protein AOT96_10740 [Rhodococcus sp. 008]
MRFGANQDGKSKLDERYVGDDLDGFLVTIPNPGDDTSLSREVRILNLTRESPENSVLRIFPINTIDGTEKFLGPKYTKIRTLTLDVPGDFENADLQEILLEALPPGFVQDYKYGLGLLKDCHRLVRLIEKHTKCEEISFTGGDMVVVDGKRLLLGLDTFEAIYSEIQRINRRGSDGAARVKDAFVHNKLASVLGLEPAVYSLGRHPVSKVLTKAADGVKELTESEQDELIEAFASESAALARTRPEKFLKLHRDVELVNLDRLIQSYEEALTRSTDEGHWQTFFGDNAFALQQVFGTPMVNFQSSASVGGVGFAGSGGKIADFLYKNPLTNNVALVEIKKPSTPLLATREYRGGVFGPSIDLAGAVTQVMDQAYQLMTSFAHLKFATRSDLEAYALSCFVVVGHTASLDHPDKQKSFEMYRANSRSVKIVTYDEILQQLKLLRKFLLPTPATSTSDEGN